MRNRVVPAVAVLRDVGSKSIPMQGPGMAPTGAGKIQIVIVEGEGAIKDVRQRVAREPIVQVEDENESRSLARRSRSSRSRAQRRPTAPEALNITTMRKARAGERFCAPIV